MLRDEVLESVADLNVVLQDVSTTQWDYHALVAELWAAAEDVIIVEQDTILPPGAAERFAECCEPWCCHDYEVSGQLIREKYGGEGGAFGCVRFRSALMRQYPNLLGDIVDRHWSHLDYLVAMNLRAHRHRGHRHDPDATHLHEYGPQSEVGVTCLG